MKIPSSSILLPIPFAFHCRIVKWASLIVVVGVGGGGAGGVDGAGGELQELQAQSFVFLYCAAF